MATQNTQHKLVAVNSSAQQKLDLLLTRKGQIVTLKTQRALKVRKGQPQIIKHSQFQCRVCL